MSESNNHCTPDLARSRHCPFTRPTVSIYRTYGPDYSLPADDRGNYPRKLDYETHTPSYPQMCVAENCMMWTWVTGSCTHGYCGLRGKVVIP